MIPGKGFTPFIITNTLSALPLQLGANRFARMARPIFVGNFEQETRQSELERLFRKYGRVERVDMKSVLRFPQGIASFGFEWDWVAIELLLRKFELLSGLANICSGLETFMLVCSTSPSTHRWNHPVFSSLDHLSLTHLTALTMHFKRVVVMISVNSLCLVYHY
ncbi:hypothetical protein NC653_033000 [Populus alba x Populus x berolinensis]|uniref:RRM domain-containing protein n=1 Tax=Populus alba x Populus x berolinensis TaxID=444605 RepID=A0AAD6LSY1_9ROSI|nr:hypothetical protein NC653_033000 [Populus alba x Populus x berolinensis]